jgi:uncharacterized membrane protein YfcA
MTPDIARVLIGLIAGILSGLVGIGGGVIIVPALVLLAGLSQHESQGTTLTLMVPPVGLIAAWTYFKAGYVDFRIGILVCVVRDRDDFWCEACH